MLSRLKNLRKISNLSSRSASSTTIGIRREDGVAWERRAPFTPAQVSDLLNQNKDLKIYIQPSKSRVYTNSEYENAGAIVQENLENCQTIIGIKQVPVSQIFQDKTYVFFSHTIKAQQQNMEMLDQILNKNVRLIDYETILEHGIGARRVAFGKWAGVVGAIDILNGLGMRLWALGLNTPFVRVSRAHNYSSVEDCYKFLNSNIAPDLVSLSEVLDSPLTVVFTGNGNVSKGAQEVFNQLNIEMVKPENLAQVKQNGDKSKIYGTIIDAADHLRHQQNGTFSFKDFSEHPENYESTFATDFAPYMNVLINGVVWKPGQPKLLKNSDLKNLSELFAISDVSADPGGSLEFMKTCTSVDAPFLFFDTETQETTGFGGGK